MAHIVSDVCKENKTVEFSSDFFPNEIKKSNQVRIN